MNSKKARTLRRVARSLKLSPETKYGVDRVEKIVGQERNAAGVLVPIKQLVPVPRGMLECERQAYQQAKKLYKDPNNA